MEFYNISVEALAAKGARMEGYLSYKQYSITNQFFRKFIKFKKCKLLIKLLLIRY